MRLDAYLARIGYQGPLTPSVETLKALHRAHLLAIPYENLDIHLGRRLELDLDRVFAKIVDRERGGWCYEMNGLFGWALDQLGFRVDLLAGTVGGARFGRNPPGNHLVLLVSLDRPWLADVGYGDGFLEPLPLEVGRFEVGGFGYRLEREGEWWVFHNHALGAAPSFDFRLAPRRLEDFASQSHELQTSAASGFVQKTVCQRFTAGGIVTLRGAVFREVAPGRVVAERVVASEAEYANLLRARFGLELGDVTDLWRRVEARHRTWTATLRPAEGAA